MHEDEGEGVGKRVSKAQWSGWGENEGVHMNGDVGKGEDKSSCLVQEGMGPEHGGGDSSWLHREVVV
jgi:hypothetical protein